ncbi:MAG: hypothetical protein HKP51_02460, partial [Sulfitobacter sp.]|nr:hypothetical protein [Sulfitobacter sp.]
MMLPRRLSIAHVPSDAGAGPHNFFDSPDAPRHDGEIITNWGKPMNRFLMSVAALGLMAGAAAADYTLTILH